MLGATSEYNIQGEKMEVIKNSKGHVNRVSTFKNQISFVLSDKPI